MLQAPENSVIVEVKTKYISNISQVLKLSAIENGSTVDPLDCVNITGTVISLPKRICNKEYYKGYTTEEIQIGDTAIFSARVIYDLGLTGAEGEVHYNNRIWYGGKELFLVDIQKLYGVIRNEEIIMVNGYVMITPFAENKIILDNQVTKKTREVKKSTIMHIGNPKTHLPRIVAFTGDTVHFNPNRVQKYQINGKKFCIIEQHHILGKEL